MKMIYQFLKWSNQVHFTTPRRKGYKEFRQAYSETENFDIIKAINDSFIPSCVVAERLFSWESITCKASCLVSRTQGMYF